MVGSVELGRHGERPGRIHDEHDQRIQACRAGVEDFHGHVGSMPIQGLAAKFLQTMKEYPPSQSPGSFNLSKIEETLRNPGGG